VTSSQFRLPDVGEGLTEAEIVTWRVAVGDTVAVNDVIVEIETAKSLVELPSPFAGVVESLLVAEGVTVPVGTPIIEVRGGVAAPEREANLVGYGPLTGGGRRRGRHPVGVPAPAETAPDPEPVPVEPVPVPVPEPEPEKVGPRAFGLSIFEKMCSMA
jgi:2-oxoisovalerate dehydrogenase E2 component (dihydrolipoyl transacylase)